MDPPQTSQNQQGSPQAGVKQRAGGQGWDHRETFWEQWERVLHIRAYPSEGQDLTGAVEGLGLLAMMAGDKKFLEEWEDRPLHEGPNDTLFATLQDNQEALEIIARLVERKGWAEKKRSISTLEPWRVATDSGSGKNGHEPPATVSPAP